MTADADGLLAAQSRKFAALVDGDIYVLGELLSEALVYTHANGKIDGKTSLIDGVAGQSYLAVTRRSADVQIYGSVGVITGEVEIAVHENLRFDGRFTDVWIDRGGWKNVAWQSTIIPSEA